MVAGQQFGYGFDTIGNRTMTLAGGDQNGANQRLAELHRQQFERIHRPDGAGGGGRDRQRDQHGDGVGEPNPRPTGRPIISGWHCPSPTPPGRSIKR